MTPKEVCDNLSGKFGGEILALLPDDKHPRVHIRSGSWRKVAEYLRRDEQLKFDWLANLSAIDYAADVELAVVYDLWSFDLRHAIAVKVIMDRTEGKVASVADLWRAADWHEREAFDLMGIVFDGHPDLRRILLADDWEGHPLQKDYDFPREYHGIPGSVELDWQQQQREGPT